MQEIIDKELFIVGQQMLFHEFDISIAMINAIISREDNDYKWAVYTAYQYGFIQGKRAERRRRKK